MADRNLKRSTLSLQSVLNTDITRPQRCLEDTDPEMLFALWEMESGADPDESLDKIEGATVLYDRYRSRVVPLRYK